MGRRTFRPVVFQRRRIFWRRRSREDYFAGETL